MLVVKNLANVLVQDYKFEMQYHFAWVNLMHQSPKTFFLSYEKQNSLFLLCIVSDMSKCSKEIFYYIRIRVSYFVSFEVE